VRKQRVVLVEDVGVLAVDVPAPAMEAAHELLGLAAGLAILGRIDQTPAAMPAAIAPPIGDAAKTMLRGRASLAASYMPLIAVRIASTSVATYR
jgi:hypothetical protein